MAMLAVLPCRKLSVGLLHEAHLPFGFYLIEL